MSSGSRTQVVGVVGCFGLYGRPSQLTHDDHVNPGVLHRILGFQIGKGKQFLGAEIIGIELSVPMHSPPASTASPPWPSFSPSSSTSGIDERRDTLENMTLIVSEGIAELINIKINQVAGLTRAARLRDLALAHGIGISVMPTGGTVLANSDAVHLAQTIPEPYRLRVWSCQDMITVDPVPGRGARVEDGMLSAPDEPGLGVVPDEEWLGEPVAVYLPGSEQGRRGQRDT